MENEFELRSVSKPFHALPKTKLHSFITSTTLTKYIFIYITKVVFFSVLVLNDSSAILSEKNKNKLVVLLTNQHQFLCAVALMPHDMKN